MIELQIGLSPDKQKKFRKEISDLKKHIEEIEYADFWNSDSINYMKGVQELYSSPIFEKLNIPYAVEELISDYDYYHFLNQDEQTEEKYEELQKISDRQQAQIVKKINERIHLILQIAPSVHYSNYLINKQK